MKTYIPKINELDRRWLLVDADGQVLGRLATRIARALRGKDKPAFTPHMDTGDFVVVTNAAKVKVTGNKEEQKTYFRHSGYPGGVTTITLRQMREKKPEELVRHAVRGMLPKNRLGRKLLKKLRVYAGAEHPHAAQKPETVQFG